LKIWNKIPIKDNGDKLIAIPSCLKLLDAHPYFHLGAPYKDKNSLWKLREEVVNRLEKGVKLIFFNENFSVPFKTIKLKTIKIIY